MMMSFSSDMPSIMKYILILGSILATLPGVNASELSQDELKLHAEQWELARNGEQLLQVPVLNKVVNTWLLRWIQDRIAIPWW
jgi:hypothetical protein